MERKRKTDELSQIYNYLYTDVCVSVITVSDHYGGPLVSIRGWVYVIDNPAMPDILKIGYSTKDPSLRAKELASRGFPTAMNTAKQCASNGSHSLD